MRNTEAKRIKRRILATTPPTDLLHRALSPARNAQADPQTTPAQAQRTTTSHHPLTTDQKQTTEYSRYATPRQTGAQNQEGIPKGKGLARTPNQPQSETKYLEQEDD